MSEGSKFGSRTEGSSEELAVTIFAALVPEHRTAAIVCV